MTFFDLHKLMFTDITGSPIYERMRQYIENWSLYLGEHWVDPSKNYFDKMRQIQDSETTKQITLNYIYRIIEKKIAFMLGLGFKIQYLDDNKENNENLDKFFKKVWTVWNNNVDISYLLGQTGMICGDAYAIVLVDEFDENGNFDPNKEKRIKIDVINPLYCIPKWNTANFDDLISFEYRYPKYDNKTNTYMDSIKVFIDKNLIIITEPGKKEKRFENPFGFVPVVHIPNKRIAGYYFGKSEIDDIVNINLEYNNSVSMLSEILDYAGRPVTLIYGASAKKIDPTSRMWGSLPEKAKVENLNLSTDLKAHLEYLKVIEKSLSEIAGIPPGSLGGIEHISNTSGVALTFMLLPLIEDIRLKEPNYHKGLKKLNELILRIGTAKGLLPVETINKMEYPYEVDVFIINTIPKDELLQTQVMDAKLKAGLTTRITAMKELGEENPEKLNQEVYEERLQDMKIRVMEKTGISSENLSNTEDVEKQKEFKMPFASGFESDTGVHKTEIKDLF